jgi:Glycosyl hydrolase family 26
MTHRVGGASRSRLPALSVTGAVALVAALAVIGLLLHGSARPGSASPPGVSSANGGQPPASRGSDPASEHPPSPSPSPSQPATASSAARLIPSRGAYLGAYVQPAVYTPRGEIAAVSAFEQSVGGQIRLVHTYHAWGDPFPDYADRHFLRSGKVLLLTWGGNPDTRRIIAGADDAEIRARALAIKRLHRPILLEFRHEMDRPNLQWTIHGPRNYIAAWDHVRAIFRQVGADNVGWVWCPTGYGFAKDRAQPFYPGNNEVDWVCADVYAPSARQSLQQDAAPFLRWARHTGKPVLIGEFGVGGSQADWPIWLLAAGELVKSNTQIKGIAYFDANGTDSNGRPFAYWIGGDRPALRMFARLRAWPTFHPTLPAAP